MEVNLGLFDDYFEFYFRRDVFVCVFIIFVIEEYIIVLGY